MTAPIKEFEIRGDFWQDLASDSKLKVLRSDGQITITTIFNTSGIVFTQKEVYESDLAPRLNPHHFDMLGSIGVGEHANLRVSKSRVGMEEDGTFNLYFSSGTSAGTAKLSEEAVTSLLRFIAGEKLKIRVVTVPQTGGPTLFAIQRISDEKYYTGFGSWSEEIMYAATWLNESMVIVAASQQGYKIVAEDATEPEEQAKLA